MSAKVQFTRIPIVGLPELACQVPVTEDGRAVDGDGEPLPLEERPNICGKDGVWMLGGVPLCRDHWPQVCAMTGNDHADVEREWLEMIR